MYMEFFLNNYNNVCIFSGETPFLCSVVKALHTHLSYFPEKLGITELVLCWENSIRQACNPDKRGTKNGTFY